jgi:hypothetical protein
MSRARDRAEDREPREGRRCKSDNLSKELTMKRLAIALALGAALILPAQAGAKNLTKVEICGVNECNTLTGPRLRDFPEGGDPDGTIAAPAPYYRIRFTVDADGHEHEWNAYFIPSADRLAAPDERIGLAWMPLDDPAMDDAAAGLKPYPRPDVTEVTIGSKHVRTNPESYFRLYTVESDGEAVAARWESGPRSRSTRATRRPGR